MKKAYLKAFAVILAVGICISSAFCVSADSSNDGYAQVFLDKWEQYADRCEELFGGRPTSSSFKYEELYSYYSGFEGATPDYILVHATYATMDEVHSYRYCFGEYAYTKSYSPDYAEYLIYLPEEDTVYTLEEAYYNRIEGVEEAFIRIYGEFLGKVGDANCDFGVNVKDVTYIQKYTAKMIECGNSNPYVQSGDLFEKVADINRDFDINIKDATMLQKLIAGLVAQTVYDKTPDTAEPVEFTEVDLRDGGYDGNLEMLITDESQSKITDHSYTQEFFEDKAFIYIRRYFYSGMVNFYTDAVYKEGDTLYVKCREVHPPVGGAVTDDIGEYHVALEIDKEYAQGVTRLVIDCDAYNLPAAE